MDCTIRISVCAPPGMFGPGNNAFSSRPPTTPSRPELGPKSCANAAEPNTLDRTGTPADARPQAIIFLRLNDSDIVVLLGTPDV